MRHKTLRLPVPGLLPWMALGIVVLTAVAISRPPGPEALIEREAEARCDIDSRAEGLLRAASKALAGAKQLSFQSASTEDVVDEKTGRVMQVRSRRSVSLVRPDRLRVEEIDRFARHRMWFAAGQLAVFDSLTNRYAVVAVPETVDAMLDYLAQEHDLVAPGADLVFSDPYEILSAEIESGAYLGKTMVSKRPCHHLAFRQSEIDWQVWIDAGDNPVLRRLVISYKKEPGHPQFALTLTDWDLEARFPEGHFDASIPPDAKKVSMDDLAGAAAKPAASKGGTP